MDKKNKKLEYTIATLMVATFVAVIFVGCKKEQDMLRYDKSAAPIMSQTLPGNYDGYGPIYADLTREAPSNPSNVRMRTFYHIPSSTYWDDFLLMWLTTPEMMYCAWPKGNCFPTVTIVADRANEFCNAGRLFQNLYRQNKVSDFFSSDDYKKIFPEMDLVPNVVDSLRTGKISLHHFHNEADSVDFYIALPNAQCWPLNVDDSNSLNVRCALRIKNE